MSVPPVAGSFTRQVNFRIGLEDWPLLEQAGREHGGIGAAIVAGLRALAERRLAAGGLPPPPAPPEEPHAEPKKPPAPSAEQEPDEGGWWTPLDQVAEILETRPQTVRRWAEESTTPSFQSDGGEQLVRLDSLEVPRHVAAKLVGVKSETLGKRVKAGRLAAPRPGYIRIGDLELTTGQAAKRLGVTAATVHKRIERGDLPARSVDGGHTVRLLDVAAAIE